MAGRYPGRKEEFDFLIQRKKLLNNRIPVQSRSLCKPGPHEFTAFGVRAGNSSTIIFYLKETEGKECSYKILSPALAIGFAGTTMWGGMGRVGAGGSFSSPGLFHAHPGVAESQNLPFVINLYLLVSLCLSVVHRSILMCAILKCQCNGKQMSLL